MVRIAIQVANGVLKNLARFRLKIWQSLNTTNPCNTWWICNQQKILGISYNQWMPIVQKRSMQKLMSRLWDTWQGNIGRLLQNKTITWIFSRLFPPQDQYAIITIVKSILGRLHALNMCNKKLSSQGGSHLLIIPPVLLCQLHHHLRLTPYVPA